MAISFDEYALRQHWHTPGSAVVAAESASPAREARLAVAAALMFNPLDASYWYHRKMFLRDLGCRSGNPNCAVAIESLTNGVHRRPYWSRAWAELSIALAEQGEDAAKASWALERAVRFGPHELVVAHAVLVVGLLQLDALDAALAERFRAMVLDLLESDAESLIYVAEDYKRTDWLTAYLEALGHGAQFAAAHASFLEQQSAASGR